MSKYTKDNEGNLELNDRSILDSDTGACDKLLQVFHRFDEGIGVEGKWQGGTVTGICRGWGTSRYVSLESIYQISDKVLNSARENVEECMLGLVNDLNSERGKFEVPDKPCDDTLEEAAVTLELSVEIVELISADITRNFTCLAESFRCQIQENCDVVKVVESCTSSSLGLLPMWPFHAIFSGEVEFFPIGFKWQFPISLPPPETRLRTGGYFLLDILGTEDTTAERFIIDVFEEFMGCAVSSSSHTNKTIVTYHSLGCILNTIYAFLYLI